MDVPTAGQLLAHPRSGASWEGFALEQVLRLARPDEAWFWAAHQGPELDLLLVRGQRRLADRQRDCAGPSSRRGVAATRGDPHLAADLRCKRAQRVRSPARAICVNLRPSLRAAGWKGRSWILNERRHA